MTSIVLLAAAALHRFYAGAILFFFRTIIFILYMEYPCVLKENSTTDCRHTY